MSQLRWSCSACAKEGLIECENPSNQYIEGYRIYREHEQRSPNCLNPFETVLIGISATALLNHPSMQILFTAIKNLGGRVEINGNKITVFSGILPLEPDIAGTFSKRIKNLDTQGILDVKVMYEK